MAVFVYAIHGPCSWFLGRNGINISKIPYPIGSMYGIYANIGGILMVNVTIYSIHGSYGFGRRIHKSQLCCEVTRAFQAVELRAKTPHCPVSGTNCDMLVQQQGNRHACIHKDCWYRLVYSTILSSEKSISDFSIFLGGAILWGFDHIHRSPTGTLRVIFRTLEISLHHSSPAGCAICWRPSAAPASTNGDYVEVS